MPLQFMAVVAVEVETLAAAAFTVAIALGSTAAWWLTRHLAPRRAESQPRCRAAAANPVDAGTAVGPPGAEHSGTCQHQAPWRAPVAPAAVQQPTPAAPPVPSVPQPAPAAADPPAAADVSPPPVEAADAADAPQSPPPQPPPTTAGAPPILTGLPLPPHAGQVPQWRLDRAATAGRGARDKLDGRVARVPQTPAGPHGPKSIFVVARPVRGAAGPGIVAGP